MPLKFLIAIPFIWVGLIGPATAQNKAVALEQIFSKYKAKGTLILERLSDGKRWIHNPDRANQMFIPASTFKIPHTIIALQTGVVSSVDEVLPWDGKVRRIRSWNKPQSLREAIQNSTVPIYQAIARKVDLDRMKKLLVEFRYGNQNPSEPVDRFWLQGPLRISPNQQINFLQRLYKRSLPARRSVQEDVIDILKRDSSTKFVHRGKTGWEISSSPAIGWYVGWHEIKHDVVFFALNMDMTKQAHGKARIAIVRNALDLVLSSVK